MSSRKSSETSQDRSRPPNYVRRPMTIGIRPTIDGRRNGVREALEEKTMALARNAAVLIEKKLRSPDGSPVRCLLSETTIGGVREAVEADRRFRAADVCGILTVTPSWCYPFETLNQDPLAPKAVWGFNGTERPGAVYLAGLASAHDQIGDPLFKIYGRHIQDKKDNSVPQDVGEDILRFARSAVAVGAMRDAAYLSIGGVSMGIAGSKVDDSFLRAYLAMRYEYVDMSELERRIERNIFDQAEYERALTWAADKLQEMEDPNPVDRRRDAEQKKEDWELSIKMALIIRDLMLGNPKLEETGYREEADGHYALAAGFQGQRQWTDYRPTGDFAEAVLNSPFDWNGIRPPLILATENDHLNALSMLFGNLLTGRSQIFADVRTYWSKESISRIAGIEGDPLPEIKTDGFIYLTNSGAAALDGSCAAEREGRPVMLPFWELTAEDVEKSLEATRWGPAKLTTFRGGGYSSSFTTGGDIPFTMLRLNLIKGIGPVLQIAEGRSIELPEEIFGAAVGRTDPTWPKTFFVPRTTGRGAFRDVYTVMKRWGSNHCVLCYGHYGADLITLASQLRIPVSMHNVPQEEIFRPTYWDHFGEEDSRSADFQACKSLGPRYGRY